MILENNLFVEAVVPEATVRKRKDEEIARWAAATLELAGRPSRCDRRQHQRMAYRIGDWLTPRAEAATLRLLQGCCN
jgi:hypothetical protein